jgi:hypothetical protein
MVAQQDTVSPQVKPECFVVMPISDPEGYETGHFQHVFDDVIAPACETAGYRPVRADQIRETNLIHLDVLQRLLESPMVLCDLSSRNPNVLFELGLRQAFDRPVVLVQELGTPKIFDIAPLRFTEYRRARVYHEVLEDQRKIVESICATRDAFQNGTGVNSIVRILSLTKPAALPDVQEANRDPAFQILRAELGQLRDEIQHIVGRPRIGRGGANDLSRFLIGLDLLERDFEIARSASSFDAADLADVHAARATLRDLGMSLALSDVPRWDEAMSRIIRLERRYMELLNAPRPPKDLLVK